MATEGEDRTNQVGTNRFPFTGMVTETITAPGDDSHIIEQKTEVNDPTDNIAGRTRSRYVNRLNNITRTDTENNWTKTRFKNGCSESNDSDIDEWNDEFYNTLG